MYLLSGVTEIPHGLVPTVTDAVTVFVVASITLTVPLELFVT